VESQLAGLARPQWGHFDLGTGYHGDVWLDLDAMFLRPALLRPYTRWLADRLREHRADAVCGPMEGGAFLALTVAGLLGAAFLPAHRRHGTRAPGAGGYGLPPVPGGIGGWRVAIVDDAVNAGTAVRACFRELREQGAVPVAVAALLSLGQARPMTETEMSLPFYAPGEITSHAWPGGQCPLCADGIALTSPLRTGEH
jgi:orotate phosphoribosyltransferase